MKVLYSWIGDNDLYDLARKDGRQELLDAVKSCLEYKPNTTHPGAVKVAYTNGKYDKAVLFWTRQSDPQVRLGGKGKALKLSEFYRQYLGSGDIEICYLQIADVNNYSELYNKLKRVIERRFVAPDKNDFLLTSGTAAMVAIMLLLGKTNYPARFLQVNGEVVSEAKIPFELSLTTVLSEINRNSPDPYYSDIATQEAYQSIKGKSKAIEAAKLLAARYAAQNYNVMICGGNGAGKELFAQAIHATGVRKGKNIICVNCAGFPDDLLESELFGYDEGAFTGAQKGGKDGLFKLADGGTLFMDEVGECSLAMQAKLLRVLQPPKGRPATCRVFRRVGGKEDIMVDVRIIVATNRDLQQMVADGTFREDLYYRLATLPLQVPSLDERGAEDVKILAEEFLKTFNENNKEGVKKHFASATIAQLQQWHWPGNVRQLQHEVILAAVMTDGAEITPDKFRSHPQDMEATEQQYRVPENLTQMSLTDEVNKLKRAYIEKAMEQCAGNMNKASELLGYKNYQTLDNDLKKLGLTQLKKSEKKNAKI